MIQKRKIKSKIPNKKEILDPTQLQKFKVVTNFTYNKDVFLPEVLFFYTLKLNFVQ